MSVRVASPSILQLATDHHPLVYNIYTANCLRSEMYVYSREKFCNLVKGTAVVFLLLWAAHQRERAKAYQLLFVA
jgi:hypothetical protein